MKYVGWIAFFLVIIGLAVGGFVLINNIESVPFKYKDVKEISYQNVDITDFVESKITCNSKGCKYRKKDLTYKISEITKLGKQEVTLDIEFENEKYSKTFEVNVVDKTKPVITLSETFIMFKINDKLDPKKYIKEVTDNYDKLNIDDVKIENNVDNKKEGKYEVIYRISDSSNNEGTAKLVVNVNKTVTSSSSGSNSSGSKVTASDAKKSDTTVKNESSLKYNFPSITDIILKPTTTKNNSKSFSWSLSSTGAYTMDFVFNQSSKSHSSNGEIIYSLDNTLIRFDCAVSIVGDYVLKIVTNDNTTGKTVDIYSTKITGYGNIIEYPVSVGNYTIILSLQDLSTNETYTETITLNVKSPKSLTDVKIENEDKGSYEEIKYYILGGEGEYNILGAIVDSNDPRIFDENISEEEVIESTDNGFKLKYKKGYYYEFALFVENNDKIITATKRIQK